MKKLFVSILLCWVSWSVFAQTNIPGFVRLYGSKSEGIPYAKIVRDNGDAAESDNNGSFSISISEDYDRKQALLIFRLLAKEEAAEVFTDMNSDMREDLINALTDSELEEVMDEMYVDDTVDVLEEMPANVVDRLLMATDEDTRKKINVLLHYP